MRFEYAPPGGGCGREEKGGSGGAYIEGGGRGCVEEGAKVARRGRAEHGVGGVERATETCPGSVTTRLGWAVA